MIAGNFNGLFAPAALPRPLLDEIANATRAATAEEDFQSRLIESGFEPILNSGPEPAERLVASELARWRPIMQATGMKLE